MRFNDRAADAKSHAGAVGLGGNKRVEDLVRLLRWQGKRQALTDCSLAYDRISCQD